MTRSAKAQRALALGALCLIASGSAAHAQSGGAPLTGDVTGTTPTSTTPTVPGSVAKLRSDGKAAAPVNAPDEVKRAIWWANRIVGKPYRYGGGHKRFNDKAYDCSGTVSYALRGGNFLTSPLDSSSFMKWGERGEGDWITVYTNPGHAFVVIAGLRLDTSSVGEIRGQKGPRWRKVLRETKGFKARHPAGF